MGGSGGGGPFVHRTPENLRNVVRKSEDETTVAAFGAELSRMLGDLLGSFNSRDLHLTNSRLDEVKNALQGATEASFDQLFGGSVAKHTYVDGLSDIDSLILINGSGLERKSPQEVLERMDDIIRNHLGSHAAVDHGRMAVTVTFRDGMVIQLLPAIKTDDSHLRVPSSRRDDWSKINPIAFQEALTRRNQECGSKLVPTIKLAKAINGQLPEGQRLSGYHIEALAIAAFKNYKGELTTSKMLPAFFEHARELVLSPVRDSTGQSVHVDEHLGPPNNETRLALSHVLGRIARRMRNASAAGSTPQWRAIFGLDQ
ncbi:CBASS oligonucleotide cyclase [Mesorhizobium sp. NZP2077]|uniref:CBASS oligonucleotide cyclase n=1 Tax=Mesorhizobium sp. NZP2077 TaxID=2483404 RepID=UPI00155215AA|nr:CBASS oligonucleotide cyclase [Mesorhizobium sp. NZP2077]QKC82552.1 nucleotidyltransferase [Mesorhizobium sp. NZP2077]QKD16045.1 nucleotidyltransferase [Mesorhizobium sp. NZP2077]